MTDLAASRDVKTKIKRTMTITLDPKQAAEALRIYFNTPADAAVTFDCGSSYEYLAEVVITWTEVEEE